MNSPSLTPEHDGNGTIVVQPILLPSYSHTELVPTPAWADSSLMERALTHDDGAIVQNILAQRPPESPEETAAGLGISLLRSVWHKSQACTAVVLDWSQGSHAILVWQRLHKESVACPAGSEIQQGHWAAMDALAPRLPIEVLAQGLPLFPEDALPQARAHWERHQLDSVLPSGGERGVARQRL